MKFKIFKWVLLAVLALARVPAFAEDTDLFAWANKSTSGSANVLFVIDNSGNISSSASSGCSISAAGVVNIDNRETDKTNLSGTSGGIEQCALYAVIKSLSTSASVTLNIGVMVFNNNGQKSYHADTDTFSQDCPTGSLANGGCLLMPIVGLNTTTQANMLKWIRAWRTSNAGSAPVNCISGTSSDCLMQSNNHSNGGALQESWAYFQGKTGVSTRNYSSIMPTGGCGNNYVIFVGNNYNTSASPGDQTGESGPHDPLFGTATVVGKRANPVATDAEKAPISYSVTTACTSGGAVGTSTGDSENNGDYALNWARYMKDNAVAKTYSVGLVSPTGDCKSNYAAHMTKLGSKEVGGGQYYSTNSFDTLVVALQTILTEILSVNSVFSSVSLPASVNTQGEYLNQVFVGIFRPDETFSPKWMGNLKQYQVGYYNGVLQTLDADGSPSVNDVTGFITACARSFWTPTTVDSYWTNYDKKGTCSAVTNSTYSNYPDGDMVEKGGHAYKLRAITPANRVVKTCGDTMAGCTSLTTFNTTNVSQAQLQGTAFITSPSTSVTSTASQTLVVDWAKGLNNKAELGMATTVMRPSTHGDVVHSRPAAVNHGSNNTTDLQVVAYYGSNDGMLRAINGNQALNITSNSVTYAPGQEMWSFMPPEFYGNIKRLYDNFPAIKFPDTEVDTAKAKSYGMDGPITSLKTTVSSVAKTYIYATMRRGGRAVYAFDVTVPGNPSLLWKRGCATSSLTDTDCTTGMTAMGQSWSQIKTFYAQNYNSGNDALIIMGGGYDTCEDYDGGSGGANHNCAATSNGGAGNRGNKVYILNAVTGAVVKSFDTVAPADGGVARGVVADAAIVNSSGLATYAYIPDLGGNVYRISFSGADSNAWTMTRIATVGCSGVNSCTANRKFMFTPSVVPVDSGTYYYILLGSGDREKPVTAYSASNGVTNYFFMIKDKPGDATWLSGESSNCSSLGVICLSSLQSITTTTPSDATLAAKKGWYMGFTTSAGAAATTEQTVTSAVTFSGQTFFSTHQPASPSANACSTNLGAGQAYCVNYANASGCFAPTASNPTGRISTITAGGLAPSPVLVTVNVSTYDYATHTYITGSGGATSKDVSVCVGCAENASGKVGGNGTGDTSAGNEAGTSSGVKAGEATGASATTHYKNRLYWFIQK